MRRTSPHCQIAYGVWWTEQAAEKGFRVLRSFDLAQDSARSDLDGFQRVSIDGFNPLLNPCKRLGKGARSLQVCDGAVRVAQLPQYLVRMLPQQRRRALDVGGRAAHAPRHAGMRADTKRGMVEIDEKTTLVEICILEHVFVGIAGEGGNAGGLQTPGDLVGRLRSGPRLDDFLEFVLVTLAQCERRETRVVGQFRLSH